MIKLLIDCDTGIDDSLALLYAMKRPDVRIVGIVTSCGNTTAAQAAENTLRIIRLADPGYEIPVAIGENKTLNGTPAAPVPHIHGHNGIGDAELPASDRRPLAQDGVDFIVDTVRSDPNEITLVTLGRLTDIALALKREPTLPKLVRNMVIMGGTLYHAGNVGPMSEANIAGDAEAADAVFCAGFPLTVIGLDVTAKTHLTGDMLDWLTRSCRPENAPIAAYLNEVMRKVYFPFNRKQNFCVDHCPVHDPLAMLAATDPMPITFRKLRLRVECGGTFSRGRLTPDEREQPFDVPFSEIAVDVDADAAIARILAVFCDHSFSDNA